MTRDGLTFTMVFLAESAIYGEGIGNITTLKKMTRGDFQQYSYISRQAMRYNIVKQLKWDNTPVDGKSGVVQFAPSATIEDYPEIDLFGYMNWSFSQTWDWHSVRTSKMELRRVKSIVLITAILYR